MIAFFLIFFSIYGSLHAYAFFKAKTALKFGPQASIVLIFFMCLMIIAPVLVRVMEDRGMEQSARAIGYSGYAWMGLLFLFFWLSISLDVYKSIVHISGFVLKRGFANAYPSAIASFAVPLSIAILLFAYGLYQAGDIKAKRITIETAKMPEGMDNMKIIQLSDVHLGLTAPLGRIQKALDIIRRENPDLLVSTGDLIDGQIDGLTKFCGLLDEINPPYGKYAITGNHEFYAGIDEAIAFTDEAGFTILRDSTATAGGIEIAGVEDPEARRFGKIAASTPEQDVLARMDPVRFRLFLKHRPVVDPKSTGMFDLQLSGHTHGGQIFPFMAFTRIFFKHISGLHQYPNGSQFYVSRGTGLWGPPIRVFAPPEVTVIELKRI